jgi:hypothetical protein
MKPQQLKLGDLSLQVTFRFPRNKTLYRTITYPLRPATPTYGNRSCLNLTTNKAENLQCNRSVKLF